MNISICFILQLIGLIIYKYDLFIIHKKYLFIKILKMITIRYNDIYLYLFYFSVWQYIFLTKKMEVLYIFDEIRSIL